MFFNVICGNFIRYSSKKKYISSNKYIKCINNNNDNKSIYVVMGFNE